VLCQNLQQSVRSAVFRLWHRPTIVLLLVYCPVDNTLFEVSPETTSLIAICYRSAGGKETRATEINTSIASYRWGDVINVSKCQFVAPQCRSRRWSPSGLPLWSSWRQRTRRSLRTRRRSTWVERCRGRSSRRLSECQLGRSAPGYTLSITSLSLRVHVKHAPPFYTIDSNLI